MLIVCLAALSSALAGNQDPASGDLGDIQLRRYEQRMQALATTSAPSLETLTEPHVSFDRIMATSQPTTVEVILQHIPDPTQAEQVFKARLKTYSETVQRDYKAIFFGEPSLESPQPGAMAYIAEIRRSRTFKLSLAEAVRRALANNYQIHFEGYGPAISTAQIVQAEAAFDMAFFLNTSKAVRDHDTAVKYTWDQGDTTIFQTGVQKLLTSGATARLSYDFTRQYNMLPSQQRPLVYNPSWTDNATAELRQPFLKNFGIDFNRAQINIRKDELRISQERFRRTVIDTLNNTETAYWNLVAARRNVVITAELVSQAERTLAQVKARQDYDAYQTLVANSEANVASRVAEFIEVKNTVGNAEDALLNILNDPQLTFPADYEIIPTDVPTAIPVVRDRFHEVETALVHRPEIQEAKASVERARIQVGVAKNQALPKLDAVFRIALNGFQNSSQAAWDQMMNAEYQDTFVGLEFLWNFGERAERAGIRAATLAHSQAIFVLKKAIDDVITDCRTTLRNLVTRFEQIAPNVVATVASEDNLRSILEREERKSPEQLNTVLTAQTQLAQNRRALLQSLINYNQAIVNLERAKGTLLEYDNVVLSEIPRTGE